MIDAPEPPTRRATPPGITPREASVAIRIADGLTYSEIAMDLGIGFETVRQDLKKLRDKTGFRDKTRIAVWTVQRRTKLVRLAGRYTCQRA